MLELSKKILTEYKIRKSKKQKMEFLNFLNAKAIELGYESQIDESWAIINNRNLIVGDIDKAEVICTAHYDTCATMPLPNIITPLNLVFVILYQLLLVVVMFAIAIMVQVSLYFLSGGVLNSLLIFAFSLLFFCYVLIAGIPNKNNYNDNTSGVITLVEIMASLKENKQKVAFIFFDNEEKGLLGSSAISQKYKSELNGKLIINFDCVSDGDNILVLYNKLARKDTALMSAFDSSFNLGNNKKLLSATSAFYPSDQASFTKNKTIAVASLKHNKIVGYYMDRIHTSKDVMFDEQNIEVIRDAVVDFIMK